MGVTQTSTIEQPLLKRDLLDGVSARCTHFYGKSYASVLSSFDAVFNENNAAKHYTSAGL